MHPWKKSILNIAILYGRMFVTAGISLSTTRLLLNAIGVADYGIFNLISGIIIMLSFLNLAMTTSTQRFISYNKGKNDMAAQKKIFLNALILHILIGLLIVIGLEIATLFLFDGFLNIPADRISAARTIYHFMAITFFFAVMAVPFTATLNAHENMMWVAIVNTIETVCKFLIALLLLFYYKDKLVAFGILTSCITIFSFLLYAGYCMYKYEECSLKNRGKPDKQLIKELSSFAGWNLYGTLCGLGRLQGLAILLNIFFGTIANTAYGIANQATSQMNFFSYSLLQVATPQIMKSEGANNRERMLRLSMITSKYAFFLLAAISIPCIFEMRDILQFWLKSVPEHAVIFCKLFLISTLTNQLTVGLQPAIQATGKIKAYQIAIGTTILLSLPIAYLFLKMGMPAYTVLISFIITELLACALRLYLLYKMAGLSVKIYIRKVFLREMPSVIVNLATCWFITQNIHIAYRFWITGIASTAIFALSVYYTGLETAEKDNLRRLLRRNIKPTV